MHLGRTYLYVEAPDSRTKHLATALAIAGGIVMAHLVTAAWAQVQSFAIIVLAGVFVGLAMEPAVSALHRRGVRRGLAAWLMLFLSFCLLAGLAATVGAVGAAQGRELIDRLPHLARGLQDRLGSWGIDVDLVSVAKDRNNLERISDEIQSRALEASASAASVVSRLLAVAFVAFWVSCEGVLLRRGIARLVPASRRSRVEQVWEIAVERTGGYLNSRVILATIASAVCSVGFWFAGSEYAIPLGVWAGVVSSIVPLVGSYLGAGLPVLIAVVDDPVRALWVLGVFLAYQQVKNLFIGPRVMRHAVKIHPLLGFSSVIVGAALAGGTGALLAIPIVATAQGFITALQEPEEGDERPDLARTDEENGTPDATRPER
jgi:predicted PurR-regulated permease PerM